LLQNFIFGCVHFIGTGAIFIAKPEIMQHTVSYVKGKLGFYRMFSFCRLSCGLISIDDKLKDAMFASFIRKVETDYIRSCISVEKFGVNFADSIVIDDGDTYSCPANGELPADLICKLPEFVKVNVEFIVPAVYLYG
jgi:hypothetical protein